MELSQLRSCANRRITFTLGYFRVKAVAHRWILIEIFSDLSVIISLWAFGLKTITFLSLTIKFCVHIYLSRHFHLSSRFWQWLFFILCFSSSHLLMKTHQIPVESLLIALKYNELKDIDLDETQCIVSNLIYEGKIKGYISHQHKKLVVSKQNAFPGLSTLS